MTLSLLYGAGPPPACSSILPGVIPLPPGLCLPPSTQGEAMLGSRLCFPQAGSAQGWEGDRPDPALV